MVMGERGMADMGEMEMPLPDNTLPMMTGTGPFGPIEMGGMFTRRQGARRPRAERLQGSGLVQAPARHGRLRMDGSAAAARARGDAGHRSVSADSEEGASHAAPLIPACSMRGRSPRARRSVRRRSFRPRREPKSARKTQPRSRPIRPTAIRSGRRAQSASTWRQDALHARCVEIRQGDTVRFV